VRNRLLAGDRVSGANAATKNGPIPTLVQAGTQLPVPTQLQSLIESQNEEAAIHCLKGFACLFSKSHFTNIFKKQGFVN
jgi:hypothetical protein